MSLSGSKDWANNAPKYAVAAGLGVSANGNTLFGNTTISGHVSGLAIGVFGVDAAEAANTTGEGKRVAHAGWNMRKQGTGPVLSISIANPGANYQSNGFIVFTGGSGSGANASYRINTISNTITSVTLVNGGSGYISTPTANAANATDVNSATFVVTMGGRTGRVHYETLVAMGSMTDDAEDVVFPE